MEQVSDTPRLHAAHAGVLPAPDGDGWVLSIACERCGGTTLPLTATDEEGAHAEAEETLASTNGICLACAAELHRSASGPVEEPYAWFDPTGWGWMVTMPLPGLDSAVTVPLGIRRFNAPQQLHHAITDLLDGNWAALRIATAPEEIDRDTPTLSVADDGRWALWRPCRQCGGTHLPLGDDVDVNRAVEDVAVALRRAATIGCPRCITERARTQPHAGEELEVWFDTVAGDWVQLVPLNPDDPDGRVAVPLGIRNYAATEAELAVARILTAAA
jgi:hypothetical protein